MLLIKIILNGPRGPRQFADAGFEPGGQIFEMNAPAAVDEGVVGIPVLPLADACVDEMETCAIVFGWQFKGKCAARIPIRTAVHRSASRFLSRSSLPQR